MDVAVDDDIDDGERLGLGGRKQDGVDHVDHTVVGGDVGHGDLGVVDEDAVIVDGDGDIGAVEGGGGGAIGEVGGQDLRPHDVVEQDVGELGQGEQVLSRSAECTGEGEERIIGRGEHGERTVTGEGSSEVGFEHCGFE